jgi:adenylate cyclase
MPPQIAAALAKVSDPGGGGEGGEVTAGGQKYLVTFIPLLHHTQDWVLGVLASENDYFGPLIRTRNQLLIVALIVIVVILFGGVLTLRAVERGLSRLLNVTARMQKLDFAAVDSMAPFRDVQRVLDSLEQAKTVIRAMGKYVPMDLVRDQFEMNREPELGGEIRELSIMFTDIAGFTTLAESRKVDEIVRTLEGYLGAMTAAIHKHSGTVDKFIGDAVMAIWNAPRPCEKHAIKACAAALACTQAARKLFNEAAQPGMAPLHMRCGLNRDRVIVGNVGSPDRINYTALGDGVNLASRLESLNKVYGTAIIVSESIHQEAASEFCFRLLDRVAVVGKRQAVLIYELRESPSDEAAKYESALAKFWNRDFAAALAILDKQAADPPSAVLADRCRAFIVQPPPPEWDGVFRAMMK